MMSDNIGQGPEQVPRFKQQTFKSIALLLSAHVKYLYFPSIAVDILLHVSKFSIYC